MASFSFGGIVYMALEILKWLIVVRCLLSFIRHDPYKPVIKFIYDVTEPVMAPFRRIVPAAGGIDFSPILVFFIIQAVQSLAASIIRF
ncbi:YggT family protein [Syntrophomonas palmitatica]|uniref:YggT family protein n=1 Tax=Syntrophomonas palmitatica TaxID=402877 RepID=UPI0006D1972A|nr:YggT family protein [Syntrophomonas palmitatica]